MEQKKLLEKKISLGDKLFWKCYRAERAVLCSLRLIVVQLFSVFFVSRDKDITPFLKGTSNIFFPIFIMFALVASIWFTSTQIRDFSFSYVSEVGGFQFPLRNLRVYSVLGLSNFSERKIQYHVQAEAKLKPIQPAIKAVKHVVALNSQENDNLLVTLPRSPLKEPRKFIRSVVTFYCSDPRYTDNTPFITANGTYVRFGIAASNIVDFDTRVSIPEVFGDTFFVVQDRMNPRYNNRPFFDIWVESCEEAKERGVHYTVVGIY